MPFLLAEILNFQGSTHRIGVGSFSILFSLPNHIRNRIHRFRHKADRLFIEHFPVF